METIQTEINELAKKYNKTVEIVTKTVEAELAKINALSQHANKPIEMKLTRALVKAESVLEKEPEEKGEQKLIFVVGIDRPKDWNAGKIEAVKTAFKSNPGTQQSMIENNIVATNTITLENGEVVKTAQLDENGDCVPLETNSMSYNIGNKMLSDWRVNIHGIEVNEKGTGKLKAYRVVGSAANPNSPQTLVNFTLPFNTCSFDVYTNRAGNEGINGRIEPVIYKIENEKVEEAINTLEGDPCYTALDDIRKWIIGNGNTSKNGTAIYSKGIGITRAQIKSLKLESGQFRVYTHTCSEDLKHRGITTWIPDNMALPKLIPDDQIILSFVGSVKNTKWENGGNVQCSFEEGDVTLTACGIFVTWSDAVPEKPDTKEIPPEELENEFTIDQI